MKKICIAAYLCVVVILPSNLSFAQSFDCRKAKRADERAICSNAILAELDRSVAALFAIQNGKGQSLIAEQRNWLSTRAKCNDDVSCLQRTYLERIEKLVQDSSSPTPVLSQAEIYNYSCNIDGKTYPLRVNVDASILEWRGIKYKLTSADCGRVGWHAEGNGTSFEFCTATKGYGAIEKDGNVQVECDLKR